MRKKIFVFMVIVFMLFVNVNGVLAIKYDNYDKAVLSCGSGLVDNIPALVPKVVSIAYTIIQVLVPVVLVIMGSLDLFKGLSAQKDDEIKKGQQMFIKRLISAVLVFFVFVIVKVVISVAADGTSSRILECTECFIENDCEKN